MNRRSFCHTLGAGGLGLAFSLNVGGCVVRTSPNVILVLVDDLGWADLGSYGSTFYETPEIDRFASMAMRFTDAYAASPVCSPTRAAIMTGQHPARLHITDWIPGQDPQDRTLRGPQDRHQLGLEYVTLAEALKEKGYSTFFAGKWHLGDEGYFPEDQGFDVNLGGHHRGSPPGGYYSPYNNPKLDDGPEGEYLPDRLTDDSIRFIEEHGNEPFFLNLSYYTVHTPIQASERHIDAYEQKLAATSFMGPASEEERLGRTQLHQSNPAYASMVEALDENFGRLWRSIEAQGLAEQTVVIFTSDNGGLATLARQRTAPTANVPLRAGKGWCYEGGIRVPLIIHAPGVTRPGSVSNVPVMSTDLFPTVMSLVSGDQQDAIDGKNLYAVLSSGANVDREALYWHFPHYHGSAWTPGAAIRVGEWKLIEFYEEDRAELYNLNEDLQERNDLSDQYPEKKEELRELLRKWQESVDAQMPDRNPEN